MPLSAPQSMGDMLSQADCLNHTMIVAPTEYIPHIPTVNTKPGEQSPAIRVDVVDFASPDAPVVYHGVLWFGVMAGNLRRSIGEFLAGRMSQGTASPGRNAPWQLADVTGEADWMNHMNNWLDNTPEGQAFQADAIKEANRAAANPQSNEVAAVATSAPAPAPSPAPAASPRPAAAPSPTAGAPSWAVASPAPAAAPSAAPAGPPVASNPDLVGIPAGLAAMIAALPADQQQAAIAVARAQAGASS